MLKYLCQAFIYMCSTEEDDKNLSSNRDSALAKIHDDSHYSPKINNIPLCSRAEHYLGRNPTDHFGTSSTCKSTMWCDILATRLLPEDTRDMENYFQHSSGNPGSRERLVSPRDIGRDSIAPIASLSANHLYNLQSAYY